MFTTAGEACLNSVIVDFSPAISSPRGDTSRGAARGSLIAAPFNQPCLAKKNAMMASARAHQE
jgi:hypothetical protein